MGLDAVAGEKGNNPVFGGLLKDEHSLDLEIQQLRSPKIPLRRATSWSFSAGRQADAYEAYRKHSHSQSIQSSRQPVNERHYYGT